MQLGQFEITALYDGAIELGVKLLIWGDVVHSHAVQFAKPDVSIEFDIDQKQAIATRHSLMKAMVASKSLVAGMHLPLPKAAGQ